MYRQVWQCLLDHKELNVNLPNQFGLSALHTACRFNVAAAIFDLLRQPGILCNERTALGSSPLMVSRQPVSTPGHLLSEMNHPVCEHGCGCGTVVGEPESVLTAARCL